MAETGQILHLYEEEVLVPLVRDAGLDPVREDSDFVMSPGSVVVLMNNADDYTEREGFVYWYPLTVIYSDIDGKSDTVFSLEASFDPRIETTYFQRASIKDVVDLVRQDDSVVWIDPISGKQFMQFPLEAADKVLMNAWYLFRGAILPMLLSETYRFVPSYERRAFQRLIIRQIHELYEGLV